ncbi:MAG: DDE-type integrase/transposase/recombinase [Christensenellales bacterium]
MSPGEDRCYPALVKDLCARKIVGYTFSGRIDTVLTLEAMDMAIRRGKPSKGLIFHGDGGVQYAIMTFRKWLESYGIR